MDIELEVDSVFYLLEEFTGDGFYDVQLPELNFPTRSYVFRGDDGILCIDEKKDAI